ncbi:hypothetical protein [Nocardioides ferulae]|uniref:hypothetical protein n=1 Tax=Nocardioides ferulae TaxID=2340821 RepID=UPI000EAC99E8|nr:hypothetical protein [Nocardioides ferulae]
MTTVPPSGPPPTQRVVLHVGLPKTGTTWLQALLADSRDRLREGGVLYPFVRPGAMFHGAVEVRGSHEKFGLSAAEVAGTWEALCARVRDFPGLSVISHEVLGGATPAQIEWALRPLAGIEVHVVVTARDLARQATAHWQEEVKLGDTRSFADFEREQFRADTGRDAGPDAGGVRPHFWHAQDFADALRRWAASLPPGCAHLVACPPRGAPPEELWRRFAEAVGVDPALVDASDPAALRGTNASLGVAAIAQLRQVNAALAGRLDARDHHRLVKREYAEGVLAALPGRRPRTPADLAADWVPVTRAWLDEVGAAGYVVHGDPEDLVPSIPSADEPHPDVLLPGEELSGDPALLASEFVTRAGGVALDTPNASGRSRSALRRLRDKGRRGSGRR